MDQTIALSIERIQEYVGGFVERIRVGPRVSVLMNEDGLALNLAKNRRMPPNRPGAGLVVRGTLLVVGDTGKDFVRLDSVDAEAWKAWFNSKASQDV